MLKCSKKGFTFKKIDKLTSKGGAAAPQQTRLILTIQHFITEIDNLLIQYILSVKVTNISGDGTVQVTVMKDLEHLEKSLSENNVEGGNNRL